MTATMERGRVAAVLNSQLIVEVCINRTCGVMFGLESNYREQKLQDGTSFQCPNGHSQWYTRKKDREAELEESLANSRANADRMLDRLNSARRRAELEKRRTAAYKGQLTRIRNRIANGVCPVAGCKRSFDTGRDPVLRHLNGQHPEWVHNHADALGVSA